MKQGFSLFSFPDDIDFFKVSEQVKKAGYDGIEPVLSERGYLNTITKEKDILKMKRQAYDCGLEISSVGVWSLWDHNLVSDGPKIRQKAEDIIKKQIECASLMEADTILVIPGYVGCDFAKKPEHIQYDIAYERCKEAFIRLASFAEKAGINIGIENVWNRFLLSPIEMNRLIEEIGSDYVGVYFDVGNIMYIGYPEDWIYILKNKIKKVHISDYRVSQTGLGGFVDVCSGDVDFYKVAEALKDIGYDDYIILEMLPNYKQFPELSMISNKAALNQIVQLMK